MVVGLQKLTKSLSEGYGVDYAWEDASKRLASSLNLHRSQSVF